MSGERTRTVIGGAGGMVGGVVLCGEPLAGYTSWRVGGPADRLYIPAGLEDLAAFLRRLPPDEPLLWLGLGSNLLVRDGGFRGTVIHTRRLNGFERLNGERVRAEAGLAGAQLARQCVRQGLRGLEFLCGIPGTVGGALALNAGAVGSETWDRVERVVTIDRAGRLRDRGPGDFDVGYRQVRPRFDGEEWFAAATFRLEPGEPEAGRELIRALLARRGATQPTQQPNAGSVFRNPPGDYAARLIESCGLKGVCVGGACVSPKHANFIVNTGTATAADIEALMAQVRETVRAATGVELVPEVHVVGEPGEDGT